MKALMKMAPGPEQFAYREIERPEVGPDDVLIEVKAAGICGSDVRLRREGTTSSLIAPVVVGHEFTGVIAETGAAVRHFSVGDRVVSDTTGYLCGICPACAVGNYIMCEKRKGLGFGVNGGFAEYVRIPGDVLRVNPHTLFRLPDHVSFEEASLMDPLTNAYKAVISEGGIRPGDDVVIYGLGTVGLLAVRIAALAGAARIIAVNRSVNEEKFAIARSFGATHILHGDMDVPEEIRKITDGERPGVVIDCAGKNQIMEEAARILCKEGAYIKVGFDGAPVSFSLDPLVMKNIRVLCHFAYDFISWKNGLRLLDRGMVDMKPLISGIYPLEQWEEAFALAQAPEGIKVLLIPSGEKSEQRTNRS